MPQLCAMSHFRNTLKGKIFTVLNLSLCNVPRSFFITVSQSCRGWRRPLEIIQFNCSAKAGTLQYLEQKSIQMGPEYLQRKRLHSLSGQPVPVPCHSHSKEVLPVFACCPLFHHCTSLKRVCPYRLDSSTPAQDPHSTFSSSGRPVSDLSFFPNTGDASGP